MSCQGRLRRVAERAARWTGIPASASIAAALDAWRARLKGLEMALSGLKRQAATRPIVATRPPLAPVLPARTRVAPLTGRELAGQSCRHCRSNPSDRPGSWYRLAGQVCCPACAASRAGTLKVSLDYPAGQPGGDPELAPQLAPLPRYTPRRTTRRARTVSAGPVGAVQGYAILAGGRETGLSLAPEIKVGADNRFSVDDQRWFVIYDRANRAVAGPFPTVEAADRMASLLANLDWQRPPSDFDAGAVRMVGEMVRQYRARKD